MVSIRVLESVGARNAQQWTGRFGFDMDKHPPYLTLALGAGSVTVMQMATAYSVFANGGLFVPPHLITRITDFRGRTLVDTPTPTDAANFRRVIPERNAFVMSSLLQEVTRSGTAARVQSTLDRNDLFGKTGTTNDALDAWFAGYHPRLTAVVWVGYGNPRNLGARETGGSLSLPIWIDFMRSALRNTPVAEAQIPEGVVKVDGQWLYLENAYGGGINSLGIDGDNTTSVIPLPPEEERSRILDLFRN